MFYGSSSDRLQYLRLSELISLPLYDRAAHSDDVLHLMLQTSRQAAPSNTLIHLVKLPHFRFLRYSRPGQVPQRSPKGEPFGIIGIFFYRLDTG